MPEKLNAVAVLVTGLAVGALAPSSALSQSCDGLADLSLPDTTVVSTDAVPAQDAVPAYCAVQARVGTALDVIVWLPEQANWNGKFNAVGSAGFGSTPDEAAMTRALSRGYATASAGIPRASGDPDTAYSWAFDRASGSVDTDAVQRFGSKDVEALSTTAKVVVSSYYGSGPSYSYFTGCGEGGRQGLVAAQAYASEYDGIIATAPANNLTRLWPGALFPATLVRDLDLDAMIAKLPVIRQGAIEQCDNLDGIKDQMIGNPSFCFFDATKLQCSSGQDPSTCLSASQAKITNLIYAGLRDPYSGDQMWPGLSPSSEATWADALKPSAPALSYFDNMVFGGQDWDWTAFNYSDFIDHRAMEAATDQLGPVLNATKQDLSGLRDAGGKLILTHGWLDTVIAPKNSVNYFESVRVKMGGTSDFFRLFMVPGMNHCTGGPGFYDFDALSALEAWVEDGTAPQKIVGLNPESGASRPLCVYPTNATLTGSDASSADSFTCE